MWSFFSYSSGGLLQEMDKLAHTSIPERGYCISLQSVHGVEGPAQRAKLCCIVSLTPFLKVNFNFYQLSFYLIKHSKFT